MRKGAGKVFKSYLWITIGAIIYCLGWTTFILPNSMVSGGVAGVSAIIQYVTGIKMSYPYAIINAILLLIGIKALGGRFGAKTIFAVALLAVLLRIFPEIIPDDFIQSISIPNGRLLCAIVGGGITGVGTAIMISHGGSSGGTDIVALAINKFHGTPTARSLLVMDIIIIASSLVIPAPEGWGARVATVIYGYIISGVHAFVIDHIINSNKQCVQLFVFSKNFEKIADRINSETARGVSVIKAEGWYSKSDVSLLMVVALRSQVSDIMAIIKEEDPNAFTSVGTVMGVYGNGFQKIKK